MVGKKIEGELFIKTLSTTLLQIVFKLMLHSEAIFKNMTGPDDTCMLGIKIHFDGSLLMGRHPT